MSRCSRNYVDTREYTVGASAALQPQVRYKEHLSLGPPLFACVELLSFCVCDVLPRKMSRYLAAVALAAVLILAREGKPRGSACFTVFGQ